MPVARKRSPNPPPRVPTAEQVDAAARRGQFDVAVETAQRLAAFDPRPKNQQVLRVTLLKAWEHYLDAGDVRMQFHLMDVGQKLGCADPEWVRPFAVLLAKSGQRELAESVAAPLNDPPLLTKLTGHYADWLMRHTHPKAVPEEWLPAFDAVLKGFLHLRAKNDEAAREALNAVGLSSPFLEWKVLLRGLLAFAANDDPRARENFARLAPDRLPFRLAAPFRAKVDPACGPQTGGVTLGERFGGGGLVGKLRAVQTAMAGKKTLKPAFKAAEAVVPLLRKELPDAVPKLANLFYHAIIRQGEQDDMGRFRKLFGPPADDPQFYRLEALVFEQVDQLEVALQRWAAYEGWLSEPRAGWPKPLADRCRAVILNRMAGIAADVEDGGAEDPFDDFDGFFAPPGRKKKAKGKPTDPAVYLRKAVELAPDWEPPVRELFARAVQNDDLAEAEAVAAKYLDRNPQSLFMLQMLSALQIRSGRADRGLELRKRLLAVNPLDKVNRNQMACAHLAHARRLGVDGKAKDAMAALADGRALCVEEVPTSYHALKSALHRKLGEKEQADADEAVALAQHGARLTARLYLHANAVLCKLKPADKTAAGKAYTAALAEQPHPKEVNMLLTGWDLFLAEGLTYTGQKTQEKKIFDAMVRAADGDGPEVEFEGLVVLLNSRKQYALTKKLAPKLGKRFPKNPVFPLALAEAELGKSARAYGYKLTEPLRKAKALAEASSEERHRQLLPKIDELLKAANPFGSLMGAFGGFFGDDG